MRTKEDLSTSLNAHGPEGSGGSGGSGGGALRWRYGFDLHYPEPALMDHQTKPGSVNVPVVERPTLMSQIWFLFYFPSFDFIFFFFFFAFRKQKTSLKSRLNLDFSGIVSRFFLNTSPFDLDKYKPVNI